MAQSSSGTSRNDKLHTSNNKRKNMAEQLQELLGLKAAPVAVTFHNTLPEDVPCVEKVKVSGCTY